jgi:hypothetical protein
MATPNLDVLHLRFSKSVEDPVAAAGTAGSVFSVAQREDYINRAINDLTSQIYHIVGMNKSREILQSMETTQAISAFSSSGVAVASDYTDMPTSLIKTGSTNIFSYYTKKDELDNNVNPNISAAYLISGNKIYAYESGAILTTGAGTFYYLRKDAGVQNTTDINISPKFWGAVIDLACILAFEETGELTSASARASRVKSILNLIGNIQ